MDNFGVEKGCNLADTLYKKVDETGICRKIYTFVREAEEGEQLEDNSGEFTANGWRVRLQDYTESQYQKIRMEADKYFIQVYSSWISPDYSSGAGTYKKQNTTSERKIEDGEIFVCGGKFFGVIVNCIEYFERSFRGSSLNSHSRSTEYKIADASDPQNSVCVELSCRDTEWGDERSYKSISVKKRV